MYRLPGKREKERGRDALKALSDKNLSKIMFWKKHFSIFLSISLALTRNACNCKYWIYLQINILDWSFGPRHNFISTATRMEFFYCSSLTLFLWYICLFACQLTLSPILSPFISLSLSPLSAAAEDQQSPNMKCSQSLVQSKQNDS